MAGMPTRFNLKSELRIFSKSNPESDVVNLTAIMEPATDVLVDISSPVRLNFRKNSERPPIGLPDEGFNQFYPVTVFPGDKPVEGFVLVSDVIALK